MRCKDKAPRVVEHLAWLDRGVMLVLKEERVRHPLGAIADTISRRVRGLTKDSAVSVELTTQFNIGALIQAQAGNVERGRDLCEAGSDLCAGMYLRTNSCEWLSALLQPRVNLGRLAARSGDCAGALRSLAEVKGFLNGANPIQGDGWQIPATHGEELARDDPESRDVYVTACTSDSIKTFLMYPDNERLCGYLQSLRADNALPRFVEWIICEGETHYHLHLAEYRRALESITGLWNSAKRYPHVDPVVLCLAVDIYREAGCHEAVDRVLGAITRYAKQQWEVLDGPTRRRLRYQLAVRHTSVGHFDDALEQIRIGIDVARSESDEGGECRLLSLAAAVWLMKDGPESVPDWILRRVLELYHNTQYVSEAAVLGVVGLLLLHPFTATVCRESLLSRLTSQILPLLAPLERDHIKSFLEVTDVTDAPHSPELSREPKTDALATSYEVLMHTARAICGSS